MADLFSGLGGRTITPNEPASSSDIFEGLGGRPLDVTEQAKPEGVVKKSWKAINKPLTSYIGIPEEYSRPKAGPIEAGIERGVTGFATGLTSPINLGLM